MHYLQVPNAKSTICIWLCTAVEDIIWVQNRPLCEFHVFDVTITIYNCTICLLYFFFLFFFLILQYGHFFPDPQYENVQHIICCDSYATYAYDFEFEDTKGFAR